MAAAINDRVWEKLEASFITISRSSMNEQIDWQKLLLFRNGVTWQINSLSLELYLIA